MKIDGNKLTDKILTSLSNQVSSLHLAPSLAVILVGDNPASESYVRQKQKAANSIHAEVKVIRYPQSVSRSVINETIEQLNNDSSVHGVILQLPLPPHFDVSINESVDPKKDVDGFVPGSKFQVPVALAVEKILQKIYEVRFTKYEKNNFISWLLKQTIVVIGRGETAGKPIADYLIQQGCNISVIHSQTSEKEKQRTLTNADIIISCVGKQRVVTPGGIKKGVILISVGIFRDSEGKLHGDYEEDEIRNIASFYTPTPGGVGPVNVACLLENLVTAANSVN